MTGRPTLLADTPMEALFQLVQMEPVSPRLLNPRVPRDLETICLKGLEKEPGRRYPTAGELADDLERFLEGVPVRARPLGTMERRWRWCRRNPVTAGLAAGAILSLLAGTCASTYFAAQANRRRRGGAGPARLGLPLVRRRYALAHRAWNDNQVPRLLELLDAHRPTGSDGMDCRGFEWFYFDNLCHSELLVFRGLGRSIRGVAYSPDGKRLAFCGQRECASCDSATGRLIRDLRLPASGLIASPSARMVSDWPAAAIPVSTFGMRSTVRSCVRFQAPPVKLAPLPLARMAVR